MRYRSKKVFVDGIKFDSKMEAARFQELKLELRAKGITKLCLQPKFLLKVNDTLVGKYTADFMYYEKDGHVVVEEVKGYATDVYKLRVKLFKALHPGIEFREINKASTNRRKRFKIRSTKANKSKAGA